MLDVLVPVFDIAGPLSQLGTYTGADGTVYTGDGFTVRLVVRASRALRALPLVECSGVRKASVRVARSQGAV